MALPGLAELESAARQVYRHMLPSPQINWPLLDARSGCEVWVKHENHNPTGAFKVRGGLVYVENLKQAEPDLEGIVSATRGNHGQSLAYACAIHGVRPVIVVPEGNSPDKNRAMQALGAELVIHGKDFDEAVPHAATLAEQQGLHRVPSFHMDLVRGVASYSLELLQAQPDLERVYVPIGLGSGICGMIAARNALGLDTEIVGVVSSNADAYALSLENRAIHNTDSAETLADGLAVRTPNPEAFAIMRDHIDRMVRVDDTEVLAAMACLFEDTHNVSEGAGAAALAALLHEKESNAGAKVGVVLSGGNVGSDLFRSALGG